MAILSSYDPFVVELMKVLGIPSKRTRKFNLRAEVNELIMVDVEMFVDKPKSDVTFTKTYMLCETPEEMDHITEIARVWLDRIRQGKQ